MELSHLSLFFQPQQQTQPDKAFEPQVKLVGFHLHKSWVWTFEPRTFSGPRVQKVRHQPQGEWWHILSHILQTTTSWGRRRGLASYLFFGWICVKKGGCKSYKGLVFWENVTRPGGKNIESTRLRPDLLGFLSLGFRVYRTSGFLHITCALCLNFVAPLCKAQLLPPSFMWLRDQRCSLQVLENCDATQDPQICIPQTRDWFNLQTVETQSEVRN